MFERSIGWEEKTELARIAMSKAMETREIAGLEDDEPLCPYSLAERLGVPVRFVDTDMEGVYRREPVPRILVSAYRPLPRRNFTCGHELGHHIFGHGSTLDETKERAEWFNDRDPNEFLVDAFSAHLLMPVLGIRSAFFRRKVDAVTATPCQILAVATEFGVGYGTLIAQLTYAFRDITIERRHELIKARAPMREKLLPSGLKGPVSVLDPFFRAATLDVEVKHLIVVPENTAVDDDCVRLVASTAAGLVYQARRRGSAEFSITNSSWATTVRIAPESYVGLARYRFLGDDDEQEN